MHSATFDQDGITFKVEETKMKGFCYCLNRAIELCSGKYIARMDTDDLCEETRLALQLKRLKYASVPTIIGCKAIPIDENGQIIESFKLPFYESNEQIRKMLPYRNPIFHSAVMYKKDDIIRAGGYKYDFHAQDHELWIRMSIDKQVQFENINEVLYYYRRHSEQSTNIENSRRHFNDIAGFMVRYFFKTGNPAYLVGAIVTHPFLRKIRTYLRGAK